MLISIIIPAYNEETYIRYTLEKIKYAISENSERKFSWEIIVCDNNSNDSTARIAQENGAIVVFEPVNQISSARNRGAENAKGEWLLFIDADTYPQPSSLADVLNIIESDKYVGCGSTFKIEEKTQIKWHPLERLNPIFRFLNLCGGAFLLCQSEAFRAINGFSDYLYAYEEVDFVIRLKRFGRKRRKRFRVLHRNPVITSGRKWDMKFKSIFIMFFSSVFAGLIFGLYLILPGKWIKKIGNRMLGYWYKTRH